MTHHDIANTTQEESTSYFLDRDTMDMTSNYLSSDWWTFKHNSQAWSRSTNKSSYLNSLSISINKVFWDDTSLLICHCSTSWINKKVVFFSWDSHKIFFLQLAFKVSVFGMEWCLIIDSIDWSHSLLPYCKYLHILCDFYCFDLNLDG